MFGSLIRRKETHLPNAEDGTFDSTTFSLSTAVPRPSERRTEDRLSPTLRVAKMHGPNGEQLVRVRNVSAGGLMAEIGQSASVGEIVTVEFSSQKIPGSVVWTRDGTVGVKFDQNIDLGNFSPGASHAMASGRGRRAWRSAARHRCASIRPTTQSECTTFRSAA